MQSTYPAQQGFVALQAAPGALIQQVHEALLQLEAMMTW